MLAALVSVAFLLLSLCLWFCKSLTQIKPSTNRNDQLVISPHTINTQMRKKVRRRKKTINQMMLLDREATSKNKTGGKYKADGQEN